MKDIENNNILMFTGERMVPEISDMITYWEHIYRYRFAAGLVKNKRVLDIACGEGYGAAGLQKSGARSVIGVDISEEACNHAREKYNLDARQGNAEAIPLPVHSVDVIVSFETIEHINNPASFLSECTRVLDPKGTLIISTPIRDIYRKTGRSSTYHCSEFSEQEMENLLARYFIKNSYFTQQPTQINLFSPRPLSLHYSPWLRLPGLKYLRRLLIRTTCPHIIGEVNEDTRQSSGDLINKRDHNWALIVNPYQVIRRHRIVDEKPVYLIAVSQLPRYP
jgi:ubiquinone/menaquinone biosynthesis C-methylase UbiE